MTQLPPEPLVPDNSLITRPEEGRALNITLARHSIHAMQKEVEVLRSGRAQYASDPN
jgi:Hexameric tyrosine-coordinated heme protein (HTHP)